MHNITLWFPPALLICLCNVSAHSFPPFSARECVSFCQDREASALSNTQEVKVLVGGWWWRQWGLWNRNQNIPQFFAPLLATLSSVDECLKNLHMEHARAHTHAHTHARTHARTHTHTHARARKHACTHTHTHTRTHTHVGFYGLRGLSIGVMVFILYKLYVLLPYTYPTPKLSPHRRRCIYIFPQKNSLCMIYKHFKLWGHWKCPHKSHSPCNTYVIPMSLYKFVSS